MIETIVDEGTSVVDTSASRDNDVEGRVVPSRVYSGGSRGGADAQPHTGATAVAQHPSPDTCIAGDPLGALTGNRHCDMKDSGLMKFEVDERAGTL
jgi:hypothetical protein